MTMLLKYKIIFLLCFICADALVLRSSSSEEDSDESSSSEEKGKNKNKDKWDRDWNRDKWDRDWNKDKDKNKDKKIKFECPAPNGMFPDTSDCTRYYFCVMNKAKSKKCNRKHHFDMFRKACLPKIMAVCDDGKGKQTTIKATTVSNTKPTHPKDHFTCPGNFGSFAHPDDCAKFYDCFFFVPTLKTCPDNTLFDGVKKQCKPESQVHCGSRRRPTTHQPDTTRRVTPSLRTTRPTKPTPSRISTDTSRSTKENTRSTRQRISTLKTTRSHKSTPFTQSTPNTPVTRKPTTFEELTTLQVTTEEQTTLKVTSEEPTTVSSTTEELTTPQITTEEPTTVEEITTTELPTTVEEVTTTTELPTTVKEVTTTTELPTTVEEITTTEVEPTGPPETNCDEDDLDCIIKETGEIPKWFKCPNDIGSFPHPSSPKLFIFCKNKKPKVKKCGQNLIYSDSLKTCVPP